MAITFNPLFEVYLVLNVFSGAATITAFIAAFTYGKFLWFCNVVKFIALCSVFTMYFFAFCMAVVVWCSLFVNASPKRLRVI